MTFNDYRKHAITLQRCIPMLFILVVLTWNFSTLGECKALFGNQSFVIEGKILAVIPADIDGKGPAEIVVIRKTGIYPSEQRWISIFSADDMSTYGSTPRQQWEVDHNATMFEVGDVAPFPGKEIFFLTSQGVRYYGREDDGLFSTTSRSLFKVHQEIAYFA